MLDIVRDYTAIAVGNAQAGTARVLEAGVGTAERIASVGSRVGVLDEPGQLLDPRASVERVRRAAGFVRQADRDKVIHHLGLVKRSELHAVRMQLQRVERLLSDARGDR